MLAVEVQQYVNRARDFLKGMDLLKEDPEEYRYSSALLGIHCAISYCDALRIGLGSSRLASENHSNATGDLKSRLDSKNYSRLDGLTRLRTLLSRKSKVAYGAVHVGSVESEEIVKQAQRFAFWAEEAGRQLRIEGW